MYRYVVKMGGSLSVYRYVVEMGGSLKVYRFFLDGRISLGV